MGRIYVTEFISVDGVVEDPGGSEDYEHGGWAFEFSRGDDGERFKSEETMGSDALLLGRVTYEGFAEAWPRRRRVRRQVQLDAEVRGLLHLTDPEWDNSTVISPDDLAGEIERMKGEHEGDIGVHGSIRLARALLDADLVDALHLMVFPVVLG